MSSQTGNDTIVIAGISIVDSADGEYVSVVYPNTLAEVKVGKNGVAIWAQNAQGSIADVTIRLVRGSFNDDQLNALLQSQQLDFAAFVQLSGQHVKRVGDGKGNITSDTTFLDGGMFMHNVDSASNADADTNQSVSIYRMRFARAGRAIY